MLNRRSSYSLVKFVKNFSTKNVGFIGVPFGKGQKQTDVYLKGLEAAPEAVRATSLFKDLKENNVDVKDYGNISYTPQIASSLVPNMFNFDDVLLNNVELSKVVTRVLEDDRTALIVGGDHSLFAGSINGHMRYFGEENVAVLYVDAHADINLKSTSPSGNIHGMCVAMSVKELQNEWNDCPKQLEPQLRLPIGNLGYIGLRSVDKGEQEILDKFGVAAYTMDDVVDLGVQGVLKAVMKRIDPNRNKSIHLSIDTDSLDPGEAPCTTLPVRGGLLLRELVYIAEAVSRTQRLHVVDWVELNPLLGTEQEQLRTLNAARLGMLACFGVRP